MRFTSFWELKRSIQQHIATALVERFNRTLTSMLAKTVQKQGRDWDEHLPYVLYAYRTSIQESTKESPFYLLYGKDVRLPTDEDIDANVFRETINFDDYRTEMSQRMALAWNCAREQIKKAQKRQKQQHDRYAKISRWETEYLFICWQLGRVRHTNLLRNFRVHSTYWLCLTME